MTVAFSIFMIFFSVFEAHAEPVKLFEDFTIEGEVQRPQLQMLMTRKNLDKEYELQLRQSFLPKIMESMKKSPF
jgi:hypothetical protein